MARTRSNPYHDFITSLGFSGVSDAKQNNDPDVLRAFKYEDFDPAVVRHTLGRAKKHRPGLLVFVMKAGRAVRVDSERKRILLGNGKKAVQALLRTIGDD
jgi:hypothetical protein